MPCVNIQLQADLTDMQTWSSSNDGYRYILLAVDCFNVQPLKTKHGILVSEAFEFIFREAEKRIDRKIKKLQVDEGKEFYNKHVK